MPLLEVKRQQPQPQLLFEKSLSQPQQLLLLFPQQKPSPNTQERIRMRMIHVQLFEPNKLLQAIV